MNTQRISPLMAATLCVCLALAGAGRAADEKKQARFVDPRTTGNGWKTTVKVEVAEGLFEKVDIWIGIVPVSASDTIWLQGAGIDTPEAEEVVHLGRDNTDTDKGKYQVRVVSFPKGVVRSDGPIKLTEARRKGMKTLASVVIERTE